MGKKKKPEKMGFVESMADSILSEKDEYKNASDSVKKMMRQNLMLYILSFTSEPVKTKNKK